MSAITVVQSSNTAVKGTTLYVEEPPSAPAPPAKAAKKGPPPPPPHRTDPSGAITPTAVYIPTTYKKSGELNVIVWFHGHWVKDYQTQIFEAKDTQKGETKLRESVDAAGQNVVLVAPFLGFVGEGADYVAPKAAGGGFGDYLEKLLDVLATQGHVGKKDIDRLVLACHSGSGHIFIQATRDLGKFAGRLKECWGYDCMYSRFAAAVRPWMGEFCNVPVYYYHGTA